MISDPDVDYAHCSRREVNYLCPDLNVALPVFSIHGNHDDPTGQGALTVLDELHIAGLINYFGRIADLENIEVTPMLLKKGQTLLALYGMSAIKDERLHRLYLAERVKMIRPGEDTEAWFNLLVTHQNRAKHGAKNYIPEHFLWRDLDLVFWGHEHECRIEPEAAATVDHEDSSGGGTVTYITQPGSSVATSLSEGETRKKCVGLLEIHKKDFRIKPV